MFKLRHKYGAKRSESDGISFPSKLERDCYNYLNSLKAEGKILFFLRQVPFDLPSNKARRVHRVDFMVFTLDSVILIESKGRDLEAGKLRRELTESLFNVDINVVKSVKQLRGLLG